VTAIALALVNVGLATTIVGAMGQLSLAPLWLSLLILVAGIAAAGWAVLMWRDYLSHVRGH
jgi:hypothetical protein